MLYVKIFQAVALNQNFIDDKTNNYLLKFTDNAPWSLCDIRLDELIEITKKYDIELTDGYAKPINTGMISLIFKGYSKYYQKTVIIKLKRKNIDEKLDISISNIETLMYISTFIPFIKNFNLDEIVGKNISIIREQTNFKNEVNNMILMSNNCKNLKYIKIPHVYRDVTENSPNCIIMEYIDGIRINQIEKVDYDIFARLVMKFGIVTTIVHGAAHGDLHSGNILFIKEKIDDTKDDTKDDIKDKYKYKLAIIDFGIIYIIDENYKNLLFDISTQMFERPVKESTKFILNVAIEKPEILDLLPKHHYENISNLITYFIEEAINNSKKANQMQLYNCLSKVKDCLNKPEVYKLGIRLSDNFIKLQLVLAMSHDVTLTLCKYDYMSFADSVINELFHTDIFNDD
jgi:predicted unusual protein kinase regulating ubiquinone biosynthesis (AarF/ABC1/UbiB family)